MKSKQPIPHRRTILLHLVWGGVIAAMYAALCILLAPISYGMVQVRVAELLTILPVFTPAAIPGLTMGCFLANLQGLSTGANLAGAWDLLFGTTATLLAAYLTRRWRHITFKGLPLLSVAPPILINAVVVGLELIAVANTWSLSAFAIAAFWVGFGQLLACGIGGMLLYIGLQKSGGSHTLFRSY